MTVGGKGVISQLGGHYLLGGCTDITVSDSSSLELFTRTGKLTHLLLSELKQIFRNLSHIYPPVRYPMKVSLLMCLPYCLSLVPDNV